MSKDDIGVRGEWMLGLILTELCGRSQPYFRPTFLGDKFPTFDYIVHLVDRPEYFFFIQVKTTTQGYNKSKPAKLKIQLSKNDVDRMVACPAPTYLVGIDERLETGYLLSINQPRNRLASMTTKHLIDCKVLANLATEIENFWSTSKIVHKSSLFN